MQATEGERRWEEGEEGVGSVWQEQVGGRERRNNRFEDIEDRSRVGEGERGASTDQSINCTNGHE